MHTEPTGDRHDALAVRSGSSNSVYLAVRQGCSSSSPRVRHDARITLGVTVRLVLDRLLPHGTEPLEPLPGVRFESARVHLCDVPGHRSDDGPGFFVVWDAPGLGRRCQCFFGSGSPMSTLFPFWVANIVIGRRCLGELSAMYADIGNLIGLFAEKAVGILLASTTGHRCRHYPGYRTFGVSGTAASDEYTYNGLRFFWNPRVR